MKTMKMNRKFIIVLLCAWSFIACDKSKDLAFSDWDNDGNGSISKAEFKDTFEDNYYQDWNITDDVGYLDDENFYTATYDVWDADDNDLLSDDEWTFGYKNFYGDYVEDDYLAYDINRDNYISYDEYYDAIHGSELYTSWDMDRNAMLDEEELAVGLFNTWDADGDNAIGMQEYNRLDSYYFDI